MSFVHLSELSFAFLESLALFRDNTLLDQHVFLKGFDFLLELSVFPA